MLLLIAAHVISFSFFQATPTELVKLSGYFRVWHHPPAPEDTGGGEGDSQDKWSGSGRGWNEIVFVATAKLMTAQVLTCLKFPFVYVYILMLL